jgi:hypothetical protein
MPPRGVTYINQHQRNLKTQHPTYTPPRQLSLFPSKEIKHMASPNFGALLDKAPSEVERPKPLPEGQYLWTIQGLPRYDKSSKKQTEFVEFTLKAQQAGPDVDQDELAAMGGIADKTTKATYYITEGSLWRLKEFLDHCGIDVDACASLREAIDETPNCQVVGFIKHEASNDGESVFARLGKTANADAFGQE